MNDQSALRPIDRDDTLGTARAGVRDWWAERLSAIALTPLSLWFLAAFAVHARAGYDACIGWLHRPSAAILMVLMLIALFRHLDLGLRVVIEDYIHSNVRLPALVVSRLLCFGLASAGIIAALYILLAR